MNALAQTGVPAVTMTSLELVDFINSQRGEGEAILAHSDFLKKVPQVLGKDAGNFSSIYFDSMNRQKPSYTFPKREACLMAMSYSYELQAKVFDRMTALESAKSKPVEMTRLEILRIAMESEEARLKAEAERDRAIATKAEIGSRREATAMATAATAKRESAILKEALGFNENFATVKAVKNVTKIDFGTRWRDLKAWCMANGQSPKDVPDKLYGEVKAWPAGAWLSVLGVDIQLLFGNSSQAGLH